MADRFTIEGVEIEQPDTFSVNFATTSTDDSDRDQMLDMHNTPIGTISSYSMGWEYIKTSEASKILKLILNKPKFSCHYYDIYEDKWLTNDFYVSNVDSTVMTLEDNYKYVDDLSFNIIRISKI